MRVLKNTGPTTLTKTWYQDGVAADPGTMTVGAVDAVTGATIIASSTAVDTDNGDGTFAHALPVQSEVRLIDFTWTVGSESQTDRIEVVGGWLFPIAELQAFHNSDLSSYSVAELVKIRDGITDEFEEICGVSFVPRYRFEKHSGQGGYALQLNRPRIQEVLSMTISGTSKTASNYVPDEVAPFIHATTDWFAPATRSQPLNVEVAYRHGFETVPGDIRRAALVAAHERAKKDITGAGVPYTASSWNDGTGQYVSFGANSSTMRWYGIPEVDGVLRRFRRGKVLF